VANTITLLHPTEYFHICSTSLCLSKLKVSLLPLTRRRSVSSARRRLLRHLRGTFSVVSSLYLFSHWSISALAPGIPLQKRYLDCRRALAQKPPRPQRCSNIWLASCVDAFASLLFWLTGVVQLCLMNTSLRFRGQLKRALTCS